MPDRRIPWRLAGLPALFLLACFVAPNALLLTASAFKSEAQVLTNELSTENYAFIFGRALYRQAIYRTFWIGASVGVLVVLLGYPVAFFLTRTSSRWKGWLIALMLAPLLASVVVRTYGWWVLLNREGAINGALLTIVGLAHALLSYAIARHRFPGRSLLEALALGPLALPALVTGIGLLQLLQLAGLDALFGLPALVMGHLVICLPFAVRTIAVSLLSIPRNAEQAAMSLGAHPFTAFREVTLPLVKSGVFAGASFAFVQSFTDYSVSLFLARPGSQPITVTILSFLEFGFAPTLAAVAVLTMIVPIMLIGAVQHFFHVGEFLYETKH